MPSRTILRSSSFFLFTLFWSAPSLICAQTQPAQGVFISVAGPVSVVHGKKALQAQKDATVQEGETVVTGADATATLRFFDGSEVKVKPDTRFSLDKLEKLQAQDKLIHFKLAVGKLLATVKKLASSKSSFEIEAGGVVCGVRGTEYEVDYDPAQDKLDLFVTDGSVWATSHGETFEYHHGEEGHFNQGKPASNEGGPDHGNKGRGEKEDRPAGDQAGEDHGDHGHGLDPFCGMSGEKEDPLESITGSVDDNHNLANRAGDDNLLGLGAHTLILNLKYPEQP